MKSYFSRLMVVVMLSCASVLLVNGAASSLSELEIGAAEAFSPAIMRERFSAYIFSVRVRSADFEGQGFLDCYLQCSVGNCISKAGSRKCLILWADASSGRGDPAKWSRSWGEGCILSLDFDGSGSLRRGGVPSKFFRPGRLSFRPQQLRFRGKNINHTVWNDSPCPEAQDSLEAFEWLRLEMPDEVLAFLKKE